MTTGHHFSHFSACARVQLSPPFTRRTVARWMGMGDEDKAATSKKQKTIRHDAQNQPHPSWRTVQLKIKSMFSFQKFPAKIKKALLNPQTSARPSTQYFKTRRHHPKKMPWCVMAFVMICLGSNYQERLIIHTATDIHHFCVEPTPKFLFLRFFMEQEMMRLSS